jgi:hypothetical protein
MREAAMIGQRRRSLALVEVERTKDGLSVKSHPEGVGPFQSQHLREKLGSS